MNSAAILPCILTCPVNTERTYQFFRSYQKVAKPVLTQKPVVVIDMSANAPVSADYIKMLDQCLDPREIVVHHNSKALAVDESVHGAVKMVLQLGLDARSHLPFIDMPTHLMFIEDDIEFLPNFEAELVKVDSSSNRGFTTFHHCDAFHRFSLLENEIDHEKFWGTQCVLFPVEQAASLVHKHEALKENCPGFWDIYWSRYLASMGFKMYCTDESCVREIPGPSRLRL